MNHFNFKKYTLTKLLASKLTSDLSISTCSKQVKSIHSISNLQKSNSNSRYKLLGPSSYLISNKQINMSTSSKIVPADRIKNQQESVWIEFGQLALDEKPLNLGQGLPDYVEAVPDHVKQNLVKAVTGPNFMLNQYSRGFGHPRLVNALANLYSKLVDQPIDPKTEVLVTIGAYEALLCAINAFIDKGDEAIIIEPFFDCYEPMVQMAEGKCKFVPLRLRKRNPEAKIVTSADWVLDLNELESQISGKTKMLILNTPHNPIGKVFSRSELEALSAICKKHDLLVLSDEVYEHLVIDGEHVRIASLPGMWERTITVGSAGKTFSATGWKLGWCYGPANLIKYTQLYHQNCIYCCPTPLQEAVAESLEIETAKMGTPDSYWTNLAQSLRAKRDYTVEFLSKANLEPTIPEGGYFLLAETSSVAKKYDFSQESGDTKDHKFVRWLSKNKKLQGIPPAAFYSAEHKELAQDFIRLCYFKKESTLKEAERLISEL